VLYLYFARGTTAVAPRGSGYGESTWIKCLYSARGAYGGRREGGAAAVGEAEKSRPPRCLILQTWNNLGLLYYYTGRYPTAENVLRRSSELWKKLADPGNLKVRRVSTNRARRLLQNRARLMEAEPLLRSVGSFYPREGTRREDHPAKIIAKSPDLNTWHKKTKPHPPQTHKRREPTPQNHKTKKHHHTTSLSLCAGPYPPEARAAPMACHHDRREGTLGAEQSKRHPAYNLGRF